MSRYRRLATEASWLVFGQIASVVGALVLVRMLTEYLGPAEYGQLALGLTVAGLVNQVLMGGLTAGIGRFYTIAAESRSLMDYLQASFRLTLLASVATLLLGGAFTLGLLWLGYSSWVSVATAALFFSLLSGWNGILVSILNAARQRAMVALHGTLDAWLRIGLVVVAVFWLGRSSASVLFGYACSSALVTFSLVTLLRRGLFANEIPTNTMNHWRERIWQFSIPFSWFGMFTWAQQVSDRWALQTFASATDVGHYAVLFQLGYTPIALVSGMIASLIGPILYQRSGDATDQTRNDYVHRVSWKITSIYVLITLFGFGFSFFTHEVLFQFLVGAEYRGISKFLPWVVLAGGMFAAGQMLALRLMSEMRLPAMTTVKIVTAIIGVLLNVSGSMLAGMQGAVAGLVAFSVIYFLWMAVLARRLPRKA